MVVRSGMGTFICGAQCSVKHSPYKFNNDRLVSYPYIRSCAVKALSGLFVQIYVLKDFGKGGYSNYTISAGSSSYSLAEVNETPRSNKRKRVTEDPPAGKNKTLITLNLEGIPTRYITRLRRALIAAAKENILVGDDNEDLLEDN
ncbi:hypothetical protein SODALDRAFT_325684 [Sodiomyces alkalinus F11]|uniref:Uncharacterized protein n=1 Tax=Sodiomyces alkalinus (strain CBS 110278 / VKM F-3762 / F11) TaxID=1314773 RepID=A0A3N2PPG8_SODAK|nr:hypothetical protein SODALDRAFT_325684 [Sodiomyces alkalinus F11]ROT36334.1 hypothetical protein SODALDRAFT_325684 [Sodiomyces alkalinus F11]